MEVLLVNPNRMKPAIAPIGPSARYVLLPPERYGPVTAVTGLYLDLGSIKHKYITIKLYNNSGYFILYQDY